MSAFRLNTPITYYGGKQKLVPKILPLIPAHTIYCEPFTGGGAVFFSKPPSVNEVLNDTNRELINFYRVVQNDFTSLEKEVRITLYSRDLHRKAWVIYNNPDMFSQIKRAWAVWVLSSQGFSGQLTATWGRDNKNTVTRKLTNKKAAFTEDLAIRLQNVQLEAADALYIINSRDDAQTFFYCDPPYPNSDCGHYDGYSMDDFEALLKTLSTVQGRFLLSSYPSEVLTAYTQANGWQSKVFEQGVSVNTKSGYQKKKWEVLTWNYPTP
jgi:DNA adenine methylase